MEKKQQRAQRGTVLGWYCPSGSHVGIPRSGAAPAAAAGVLQRGGGAQAAGSAGWPAGGLAGIGS